MRTTSTFKLAKDPPDTEEIKSAVSKHAENFLRAGGVLSLDDWAQMSEVEHKAFVAAGNRIRIENSVQTGLASQSHDAAAALYATVDGGKMKVRAVIENALAERIAKDSAKGV